MKKVIFSLVVCVLIFACEKKNKDKFSALNHKVDFNYIQFGEGESPKVGQEMMMNLIITDTLNDTLHYVPDYSYFIPLKNSAIDSAWMQMKEGDSACFRMNRAYFNKRFRFYGPSKSNEGKIFIYFSLNKVLTQQEASMEKKYQQSKREIDEQASLKRYLKQFEAKLDTLDGIYRIVKNRNPTGDSITEGSSVSIDYRGSFIDGYVFEDTYEKGITPTFNYGREYQLIEGMHIGLNGLKSGESVKIILPSQRAFGSEGSLAGIVPPYTAVIFDVEIKKVIQKK